MCKLHKILETLSQGSIPSENDIGFLLNCKEDELQPLFLLAREVQHSVYGRDVDHEYLKSRLPNYTSPEEYYSLRDHIYADFSYMNVNDL